MTHLIISIVQRVRKLQMKHIGWAAEVMDMIYSIRQSRQDSQVDRNFKVPSLEWAKLSNFWVTLHNFNQEHFCTPYQPESGGHGNQRPLPGTENAIYERARQDRVGTGTCFLPISDIKLILLTMHSHRTTWKDRPLSFKRRPCFEPFIGRPTVTNLDVAVTSGYFKLGNKHNKSRNDLYVVRYHMAHIL